MLNAKLKSFFTKKIKYFLINFAKQSIIISKYILNLLLVYAIKIAKKIILYTFIKKIIPYRLKLKIKSRLLYYPKLRRFLRLIHIWIKNIERPKETIYSAYILPLFIKKIGLPILSRMLNKELWKKIMLDKLKKTPHLHLKFKRLLLDEKYLIAQHNHMTACIDAKQNADLNHATDEIYNDLKMAITRHQTHY